MTPTILRSHNLVADTLTLIDRLEAEALADRGAFHFGLSGGNTPRPVYEALAKCEKPWEKWLFTFGDERCVPPDDKESNYRMVRESLFNHAPIPAERILRMHGEQDPATAAAAYEEALRAASPVGEFFRHDLLLLGMGDDGHTASLFPGTEALSESRKWVTANFVPKFDTWRISLTYPLLNAARHVCFVVNSKGKEAVLDQVLAGDTTYPCTHVRPTDGHVTWLIGG